MRNALKRPLGLIRHFVVVAGTALLATACNGADNPTGPGGGAVVEGPLSIRIDPGEISLAVGESVRLVVLTAGPNGEPGIPFQLAANATLTSANPSVAEVSSTGMVTAHAPGSTVVTATVGRASAFARVSVH